MTNEKPINHTFGLTSAISFAGPEPIDIERTNALQKCLELHGVFESEEELGHRMEVLGTLNGLVRGWVKDLSIKKHLPQNVVDSVGGNIYTFGSYRLGVHQRGADIDALLVAPRHISRTDYFSSFYEVLKKQPEVKDLRAVQEAYVPVIKMNFDGIEIDLLFARLALKKIPESLDIREDMLLKNLDIKCVRSLNGYRLTEETLSLVPNVTNFRLTLRAIKLWAKRHGIYSNALGFFGGVTWALLVARICQVYPNASASTLVHKFFLIITQWTWPRPVLLKKPTLVSGLSFPVWDSRINLPDRDHLMPVITPAYPHQNSTYNVSKSSRIVIVEELRLGLKITEEIMLGKCKWDKLFESPNFFSRYKHFNVLLASAAEKDHLLQWGGLVESQMRHLVGNLERTGHIALAHINPQGYKSVPLHTNDGNPLASPPDTAEPVEPPTEIKRNESGEIIPNYCSMWFIGIVFEAAKINIDLTYEISAFTDHVHYVAGNSNMLHEGMSIEARFLLRKQLKKYLSPSILRTSKGRPSKTTKRKLEPTSTANSAASQPSTSKKTKMSEPNYLDPWTSPSAWKERVAVLKTKYKT